MRFDRSYRVLLKSPSLKDRSFMREDCAAVRALFDGLTLARGETAYFQHYMGRKVGWMTITSKSGGEREAA